MASRELIVAVFSGYRRTYEDDRYPLHAGMNGILKFFLSVKFVLYFLTFEAIRLTLGALSALLSRFAPVLIPGANLRAPLPSEKYSGKQQAPIAGARVAVYPRPLRTIERSSRTMPRLVRELLTSYFRPHNSRTTIWKAHRWRAAAPPGAYDPHRLGYSS